MLTFSLVAIVLLVLILPITVHYVEKNLEAFLFVMGVASVSCVHAWGSGPAWSYALIHEALTEPVMITAAVMGVGLMVFAFKNRITKAIVSVEKALGTRLFGFFLVAALGLISSVITAIMASLLLVEIVSALKCDRVYETRLVILGCFAIGLGAALTPVGEPLSTIAVAKLRGEPYNADFLFLLRHLGAFVIPGIFGIGIIGAMINPGKRVGKRDTGLKDKEPEKLVDIFICAAKVYVFIIALVLLGTGFKPIIDQYIIHLPSAALYWINSLSAVMDNATLTAAEISPKMTLPQIQMALVGLLIAGGMLIPGNIPNIICAGRLNISSKAWARFGIPFGFALMALYFVVFLVKG